MVKYRVLARMRGFKKCIQLLDVSAKNADEAIIKAKRKLGKPIATNWVGWYAKKRAPKKRKRKLRK